MKKIVKILICLVILMIISSCQKISVDSEVANLYVNAKSYIVLDTTSKRVLEGNNIHKRILPASTTKILTCLTVLNYFDINNYVVITNEMLNTVGSKIYLEVGDIISIKDLLYGLMLNSGNDASTTLAISLAGSIDNFVYLMNEECKRIGMFNSTFENPSGLDESTKNYTTAYDMSLLMKAALENDTFRKITSTKEYQASLLNGRKLYFNNKHRLVHTNDYVTGGKTGYTKKAGRTLLTSFKQQEFEIVVATFDCSNDWEVHTNLAKKIFSSYELQKLTNKYQINKIVSVGKIDINKLLFPIHKCEDRNDFNIMISNYNNEVILSYYKEEEKIGEVKLK